MIGNPVATYFYQWGCEYQFVISHQLL